MATLICLNTFKFGTAVFHAGNTVDSTKFNTQQMMDAGALFGPGSDPTLLAAAKRCQALKNTGGASAEQLDSIMRNAVAATGTGAPRGDVTTTDNTQTVALVIPVPDNCVARAEVSAMGRRQSNGNGGIYQRVVGVKRINGGNAVLIGSVVTPSADQEDEAGWDVTVDANGTNLRVLVTGSAAETINWLANAVLATVS